MKRCTTCLRKEKVCLVDLNILKERKTKIKFKQCKKRIGKYCFVLFLDKIKIII